MCETAEASNPGIDVWNSDAMVSTDNKIRIRVCREDVASWAQEERLLGRAARETMRTELGLEACELAERG